MTYFRTVHSSWYQVPVLYDWWDLGPRARPTRRCRQRHANGQRPRATGMATAAPARPSPCELTSRALASALLERGHRQSRALQLLPVVLCGLLVAAEDDRLAAEWITFGDLHPALDADPRDEAGERAGDVIERVVVVVADDHPPGAAEAGSGAAQCVAP